MNCRRARTGKLMIIDAEPLPDASSQRMVTPVSPNRWKLT
jgi:hypothetical protein